MWYNCTFPKNETLNTRCCPQGNVSTTANTAHLSSCFVGFGNATDFNQCMRDRNESRQKCYLQDIPSESTVESSALRPRHVGWSSFALLVLALSLGVQAQDTGSPVCRAFTPDPRDTWNLDAEMPHMKPSALLFGGLVPMDYDKDFRFETLWTAEVLVTGDFDDLAKQLPQDRDFRESFEIPQIPDKFPVRSVVYGYLAASTNAAVIPGSYTDCNDGRDRRGNVTVPERRGIFYYTHHED